jgi:hypothetical protein
VDGAAPLAVVTVFADSLSSGQVLASHSEQRLVDQLIAVFQCQRREAK